MFFCDRVCSCEIIRDYQWKNEHLELELKAAEEKLAEAREIIKDLKANLLDKENALPRYYMIISHIEINRLYKKFENQRSEKEKAIENLKKIEEIIKNNWGSVAIQKIDELITKENKNL